MIKRHDGGPRDTIGLPHFGSSSGRTCSGASELCGQTTPQRQTGSQLSLKVCPPRHQSLVALSLSWPNASHSICGSNAPTAQPAETRQLLGGLFACLGQHLRAPQLPAAALKALPGTQDPVKAAIKTQHNPVGFDGSRTLINASTAAMACVRM